MLSNFRRIRSIFHLPITNVRRVTTHVKTTPYIRNLIQRHGPLRYNRLNTTIHRSSRPLLTINGYLIRRDNGHHTSAIARVTLSLPIQIDTNFILPSPLRVLQILLRASRLLPLRPTRIRLLRPLRQRRFYVQGRSLYHLQHTLRQHRMSSLQKGIHPPRLNHTFKRGQSIPLTLVPFLNIMFHSTVTRRVSPRNIISFFRPFTTPL